MSKINYKIAFISFFMTLSFLQAQEAKTPPAESDSGKTLPVKTQSTKNV